MSFDRERLRESISRQDSLSGMREAFRTIRERQKKNLERIPDLEERKKSLKDKKTVSVGNQELVDLAMKNLEENGFKIRFASDVDDAIDVILREIGDEKLVVKSKSTVSKEIDLTRRLEERGIEVVETDLGDRIIQISGDDPVHPTGPAAHLTRYQIAEILSKHFDRGLPPDPDALTEAVRQELDSFLKRAKIGITGANAIAAAEGSIILVHNEGNITRCTQSPTKHIILATTEKILPTLDDAINQVKTQTYFATGKLVSAHIDIVSGPSYTADIEKKIFTGMHGPRELVIVFIDMGRSSMRDSELLHCISCGNCLLTCPVYDILGPVFGTKGRMGGMGVVMTGAQGSVRKADEGGLFLCLACGNCQEQCPVAIDLRPGLLICRGRAAEEGMLTGEQRSAVSSIENYDNPWLQPRAARAGWAEDLKLPLEGETFYYPGCSIAYLRPEFAHKTIELLREAGIAPAYLGSREPCCGSIARKLGDESAFEKQATRLIDMLLAAGAKRVIVSCPGCMVSLKKGKELLGKELEIVHITEALRSLPKLQDEGRSRAEERVTYHDPCELGRGLGLYNPPRELIESIPELVLIELERSKNDSDCCGAGSGVKTGYPELAGAIARKRIEMARSSEVEKLLTCCPWCLQNLSEAAAGTGIEVVDLIDLLHDRYLRRQAK